MHLKSSKNFESDNLKSISGKSSRINLFGDIAAFLIPALLFIETSIGGRLFLTELLVLFAIPFLLFSKNRIQFTQTARRFLLLIIVWLLAQMLTDVIRDIPVQDFARGWARIVLLGTNFIGIYLLVHGNPKRLILFSIGIAVSRIFGFFVSPSEYAFAYPWKFGYGSGVTFLIILSTQLPLIKKLPFLRAGFCILAAAINFYFDFRSLGLTCFIVAIFIITKAFYKQSGQQEFSSKSINISIATGLVAIYLISVLYSSLASSGIFGEDAKLKYEYQSSGQLGILLGGRTELFASSVAIADSPIIGHGSWAKDPKYNDILKENLANFDYKEFGEDYNDDGQIPSHSYLFGAWVESGFFGTFIWFWSLALILRLIPVIYQFSSPILPVVVYFSYLLAWNILFSAFGASGRFSSAFYMIIVMSTHFEYQKFKNLNKQLKTQ